MITLNFGRVNGLPEEEAAKLEKLLKIYKYHQYANANKQRYYDGKITLKEVNLGIALPSNLGKLKVGCNWGAKAVDVLASRSRFDGYVTESGADSDAMVEIIRRNRLIHEYAKACKEELKYGCAFACASGEEGNARIRFYSPNCAAADWDGPSGGIGSGFAFEDARPDESDKNWSPQHVNFYTDTATWTLDKVGGGWIATEYRHEFGKPLMVPMIWNATADQPLGKSRLNAPTRRLIEGYIRTIANATIGLEFATSPQKYLLGITDEQYDALVDNRFRQYVGSMFYSTNNPETGEKPSFGQLQQGTISPHVEMLRALATQFSAATGLTVTDTGVINDANPTSSEAIMAQSQTLVLLAEQLNTGNGNALYQISQMALAIELGTTPDNLADENKAIVAHFKNPAMPSVASTADAAIKIASARDGFSETDVFLEMIGFDQADIRRIRAQEQRARGRRILMEEFADAAEGADVADIRRQDGYDQPEGFSSTPEVD